MGVTELVNDLFFFFKIALTAAICIIDIFVLIIEL